MNMPCKLHNSSQEQMTHGSFIPHGRQDILNTAIEQPDHPGYVRAVGVGVTISQYFGHASRGSNTASTSINPE